MPITLGSNLASLKGIRQLDRSSNELSRVFERLGSGQRINRASDDAAGLAIASDLNVQNRVLHQAIRNINDGISIISIADSALGSLTGILVRGAELAEQAANGTYNEEQKQTLQNELDALTQEVDRIVQTTEFNGERIFNGDPNAAAKSTILNSLKASWLTQAEQLIQTHYGLTGDGADLEIVFESNAKGGNLAYVQGYIEAGGTLGGLELHIDLQDFVPGDLPNGGTAPFYDDRIIAHEMVHAVMGRTMDFAGLETWFSEGAAEFIHGADERVAADQAANGGGATGANAIANQIDQAWTGSSLQYSTGYAAVRFLHDRIDVAGGSGIADVLAYLNANANSDLDEALTNIANGAYTGGLSGANSFYEDFKTNGNGSAYIQAMDLGNADTGAIGGLDADGGPSRDAASVVPDTNTPTEDPLANFAEIYPDIDNTSSETIFAVGTKGSDFLALNLTGVSTESLNLSSLDIVNNGAAELDRISSALDTLSATRGKLGAFESRFVVARSVAQVTADTYKEAEGRIMDADVAQDAALSTSQSIKQQVASSILSQANQLPALALSLLG